MDQAAVAMNVAQKTQKKIPKIAPLKLRWMAFMIDMVILGSLTTISSKLLGLKVLESNISTAILYFPISAFFHKEFYSTPGKMLLGFVVMDSRYKPMTWKTSIVRSLVSSISICLFSIGHFVSLFNKKNLAAHDYAAKTVVLVAEEKSKGYISLLTLIIIGVMFGLYYLKTGSLVPPGR